MLLPRHHDPIVAVATAPGRGAIGIVRVSGREIEPLIEAVCGQRLVPRHATHLAFRDAHGAPIDRGLALHFPAPQSYTGESVLELQAHGGPVVLQLLLARCLEAAQETDGRSGAARLPGLRLAAPGEFTERAFLNDKLDLAQAEAVADLIDASTEAAARSAGRSLDGAFAREIGRVAEALVRLRTLVEATLDFPEEEIDFLERGDARGQLAAIEADVHGVLDRARQGALLREGITLVLAGQPNVGKSSLLNALAGAELAIVTPIPGTTRDKVSQTIQIEGVPLHVIDTAGLRGAHEAGDEAERIGIGRSWQAIQTTTRPTCASPSACAHPAGARRDCCMSTTRSTLRLRRSQRPTRWRCRPRAATASTHCAGACSSSPAGMPTRLPPRASTSRALATCRRCSALANTCSAREATSTAPSPRSTCSPKNCASRTTR